MDFSSDVLIDFGLNLAGYLIVSLLIYVLVGRRAAGRKPAASAQTSAAAARKTAPVAAVRQTVDRDAEFVPLNVRRAVVIDRGGQPSAATAAAQSERPGSDSPTSRQQNRRAIYEEARRLLAGGKSRSDLLTQLPVTEGELEMLSVTGKA